MNKSLLITSLCFAMIRMEVIRPRSQMPSFEGLQVLNGEVSSLNSKSLSGKYLVLIFYPFDFTYVCPTELVAFSQRMNEFDQLDTKVYGISTDSHFTHLAWT